LAFEMLWTLALDQLPPTTLQDAQLLAYNLRRAPWNECGPWMRLLTLLFSFRGQFESFETSDSNPCLFEWDCQFIAEVALFQLITEDYFKSIKIGQMGTLIVLDLELDADLQSPLSILGS
jgi:hypothetical protein